MKTCTACATEKPLEDFYNNKNTKDGKGSHCKPCAKANAARWRAQNPGRRKAYMREYRNQPEHRARQRKYQLKRLYGMTLEAYDRRLADQGGVCAICAEAPEDGTYLHVDHAHETGDVRALLCLRCNTALGLFRDDPELLRRASEYLLCHEPV